MKCIGEFLSRGLGSNRTRQSSKHFGLTPSNVFVCESPGNMPELRTQEAPTRLGLTPGNAFVSVAVA